MSFQTLIDRTKRAAFLDELLKLSEEEAMPHVPPPTRREAMDAAKVLTQSPAERMRGHLEAGVVSMGAAPAVAAIGRGVKGFVDGKGNRGAAALKAVRSATKGDIAQQMTGGLLTAAAISAGRSGFQQAKARHTYDRYLQAKQQQQGAS